MRRNLKISASWLCFQTEEEDKNQVVEQNQIKWEGLLLVGGEGKVRHSGSAHTVEDFFGQLKDYFGRDLMDLNNEVHVEISHSPDSGKVVKRTTMSTGKYMIYQPLSFEEKSKLTILLNALKPS